MKTILAAAAVFSLLAGPAVAGGCPADMKAVDAALANNPKLSEADMKMVKDQRMLGEKLHAEGKHKESMDALAKAKKPLGI